MTQSLNERKRQILFAVINDYITTATPVGSKKISGKYKIDLSPATIRSVMADLEEMGLLTHPHTSAGRIPTKTAFKFYVDSLIQVKNLSDTDKQTIEKRCADDAKNMGNLMQETSKILSNITNYAGIVLAPKRKQTVFKHLHFIKLKESRLLAVLVTRHGIIQNKIIEIDGPIADEELNKIHNYLNETLHNLTLEQVRVKILKEMKKEKVRYDKVFSRAINLGEKALSITDDPADLIIEGESNLVDQPEFSDMKKLKNILKALEMKTMIVEMLERTLSAEGIQIFVGAETIHPELTDVSIITSRYKTEEGVLGTLGVIGPTRMNYGKVIPLVDYTAKFLTKLLKESRR